jgi:hypothetical protein
MAWRCMGEWEFTTSILNLNTRWRSVVSFTPQLFYVWGKSPQYPMERRLGGPHSQSGCFGEEKNLLPLLAIESQLSSPWPSLYSLSYCSSQVFVFARTYSHTHTHTHKYIHIWLTLIILISQTLLWYRCGRGWKEDTLSFSVRIWRKRLRASDGGNNK